MNFNGAIFACAVKIQGTSTATGSMTLYKPVRARIENLKYVSAELLHGDGIVTGKQIGRAHV